MNDFLILHDTTDGTIVRCEHCGALWWAWTQSAAEIFAYRSETHWCSERQLVLSDYLLAEARWWAEQWRADAWDYCRDIPDPDGPTPGEDVLALPWEELS